MRVESPAATSDGSESHNHTSAGKARAHGLVRKLQDDTFNGASLEKHRARFADRLGEIPVEDAGGSTEGSDVAIQDEVVQGPIATPFYDSSFALYPVSGTGQHVQWIA